MAEINIDCIEMKHRIQEKLEAEWEGLTIHEIAERCSHFVETSTDPLAVKFREKKPLAPVHKLKGEPPQG
ncbi:MAG: hypothetical protein HYV26_03465 [Candidatus Hydrogenedentes bacterium]|nr:hypothetical protein [Candidatus Hydrogenedentota bacterium]MBI3118527.1 hypothetical protein [Candidatus Hydrogenedentota bacterium]